MILVDSHEPKSILEALGKDGKDITLPTGDYLFFSHDAKKVLIERKTVTDLLGSLSDRSLHDQIRRLVLEADYPILLIEGYLTSTRDGFIKHTTGTSGWRWVSAELLQLTFQLSGVYRIYTTNVKNTAEMLLALYNYFQKKEHTSLMRARALPIFPNDENTRRVEFLAAIPGIGPGRAERVLERFKGPGSAVIASEDELLAIHGIGEITVREWMAFLWPPLPEEAAREPN